MESTLAVPTIVSGRTAETAGHVLTPATRYSAKPGWHPENPRIDRIWKLPAVSRRAPFWIFCSYSMTEIRLFQRLPDPVRSCRMVACGWGGQEIRPPVTMECR